MVVVVVGRVGRVGGARVVVICCRSFGSRLISGRLVLGLSVGLLGAPPPTSSSDSTNPQATPSSLFGSPNLFGKFPMVGLSVDMALSTGGTSVGETMEGLLCWG